MFLVLATASASLSDVIDGGVPRTMGKTLGEALILSAHIPTASEGSLVKTFKMLKCHVFSRGNVNFEIHLTFDTHANVKTARVVLKRCHEQDLKRGEDHLGAGGQNAQPNNVEHRRCRVDHRHRRSTFDQPDRLTGVCDKFPLQGVSRRIGLPSEQLRLRDPAFHRSRRMSSFAGD